MDDKELELLRKISETNEELRDLYAKHQEYEKALAAFQGRPYLTAEEEVEKKRLKKLKLAGKDRIDQILRQSREA